MRSTISGVFRNGRTELDRTYLRQHMDLFHRCMNMPQNDDARVIRTVWMEYALLFIVEMIMWVDSDRKRKIFQIEV